MNKKRPNRPKLRPANWWLAIFLACSSAPSSAASYAPFLNTQNESEVFDHLAETSDAAAHVRVVKQSYRLIDNGSRIVTDSECDVIHQAYGNLQPKITITTLGGYYGHIGQKTFGLSELFAGEEYALFLSTAGYMKGGRAIVGEALGLYRVINWGQTVREPAQSMIFPTFWRSTTAENDSINPHTNNAPRSVETFLQRARASKFP